MAARQVPGRVRRAVEVLALAPSARILEIGCGPGATLGVRQTTLADLDAGPGTVDLAFAVDVNVFWTAAGPRAELAVLRRVPAGAGGRRASPGRSEG